VVASQSTASVDVQLICCPLEVEMDKLVSCPFRASLSDFQSRLADSLCRGLSCPSWKGLTRTNYGLHPAFMKLVNTLLMLNLETWKLRWEENLICFAEIDEKGKGVLTLGLIT